MTFQGSVDEIYVSTEMPRLFQEIKRVGVWAEEPFAARTSITYQKWGGDLFLHSCFYTGKLVQRNPDRNVVASGVRTQSEGQQERVARIPEKIRPTDEFKDVDILIPFTYYDTHEHRQDLRLTKYQLKRKYQPQSYQFTAAKNRFKKNCKLLKISGNGKV